MSSKKGNVTKIEERVEETQIETATDETVVLEGEVIEVQEEITWKDRVKQGWRVIKKPFLITVGIGTALATTYLLGKRSGERITAAAMLEEEYSSSDNDDETIDTEAEVEIETEM